jgi:hypothetical protein
MDDNGAEHDEDIYEQNNLKEVRLTDECAADEIPNTTFAVD